MNMNVRVLRPGMAVQTDEGVRIVETCITRELDHDEVTRITYTTGKPEYLYSDATRVVIAL